MASIAGVDIPKDKRILISLTYIYGIGRAKSEEILNKCNVDPNKRVHDLTDEETRRIRSLIGSDYTVEGTLLTEITMNIKRLMDINCYRGIRHKRGLPAHGQRTRTNARTRKGRKKTVGAKRKK